MSTNIFTVPILGSGFAFGDNPPDYRQVQGVSKQNEMGLKRSMFVAPRLPKKSYDPLSGGWPGFVSPFTFTFTFTFTVMCMFTIAFTFTESDFIELNEHTTIQRSQIVIIGKKFPRS